MSFRSESDEDVDTSVLDLFEDWYHVPLLAVIVGVMLRIRLLAYDNFVRGGEVLFSGNDAWFHLRETTYVVKHWPFTMPFDPWTGFPVGKATGGQFGSLYDQIVATVALLLGLGDPSSTLIAKTLLVAPAVFGALAAIPTYYIGKRFGGRIAGILGATILMLLPGTFLSRTLVGVADHNAAEPFFQATAVAALLVAFGVAEREKPVWELVEARDWDALKPTLIWSAIAGAATAIYMWVWPPGILLVGVVAVFLVLKLSSDVYNGDSPEPVAFVAAVSMGVTALLMAVQIDTFAFSTTDFSVLQPAFSLLVGAGAVFMAYLAREWESRNIDLAYYPFSILGLLVLSLLVAKFLLPGLYGSVESNFYRILAFSAAEQTRTIGEAQPFLSSSIRRGLSPVEQILTEYGFAFFTGLAAAVWMLAKPLVQDTDTKRLGFVGGSVLVLAIIFIFPGAHTAIADAIGMDGQVFALFVVAAIIAAAAHLGEHDSTNLFVIVWAAFITSAAFTQVRFNYYLAVVVAVMNAYLFGEVLRYLDLRSAATNATEEIETYQVITVLAVVMLVLAPVLVVPLQVGPQGSARSTNTATQSAQAAGPGGITQWQGALDWMSNQTPAEGSYGGADNADQMEYYGTYERTDDFDYPEGAYGVMSWWDYGHWITVEGHRIPNANPFQQGATTAANYLLAPNATQAEQVLNEQGQANEPTRYVMVDWQMASTRSKFGAPVVFYDAGNVSQDQFYSPMYQVQNGIRPLGFNVRHQRYYESQMIRLYFYHGSAMEPQPIVTDWKNEDVQLQNGGTTQIRTPPTDGKVIKQFNSMKKARAYVEDDPSSQIGGVGKYPTERVSALEHYRLVKASNSSQTFTATRRSYPWVKSFERVPGATIEGSGAPANTTVRASVQMRVPANNRTFRYTQRAQTDENGEFTMTLPYSTTGYENFGPENGYTNVSVRATGPYTLATAPEAGNGTLTRYGATVNVSESRVVGADESAKQITLEQHERNFSVQRGQSSENQSSNALAGEHLRSGSDSATAEEPHASIDTRPGADAAHARPVDE